MADEIEKKFLLDYVPEDLLADGQKIAQGYMEAGKDKVIRIRLYGDDAFITVKSKTVNSARKEYEYPIPVSDAMEMLGLFCVKPYIQKIRYLFDYKGFTWEIDRFEGANSGLIVAEIELDSIDQSFEKPDWIGKEVTGDPKYFNSNLVQNPFNTW